MKTNSREKTLAIAVALSLAVLIGDQYVLTPLQKLWSQRSGRIASLKQQLEKGKVRLGREQFLHARWNSMRTNTLPADVSVAESKLQVAVDQWRQASSITVSSIKPQWKQNLEDYSLLECQTETAGNMQSVARYLYAMEKDPLPLQIENVAIVSRDNEGQQLTLHASFTALQLTNTSK